MGHELILMSMIFGRSGPLINVAMLTLACPLENCRER
jgi:hypothetical protein